VSQSGVIEKAKEAECAYKVSILNAVYDQSWNYELSEILRNFNFREMKNENGLKFSDLLKEIIEMTGPVARLIVSVCNNKLTEVKTKKEQMIYSSLSEEEVCDLTKLKLKISSIRVNSAEEISLGETRAERTVLRERVEREINAAIDDSKVSILYRIIHKSSEFILEGVKIKISKISKLLVEDIKREEKKSGSEVGTNLARIIQSRLRKRGFREYLSEAKAHDINVYRNGGDEYKLTK